MDGNENQKTVEAGPVIESMDKGPELSQETLNERSRQGLEAAIATKSLEEEHESKLFAEKIPQIEGELGIQLPESREFLNGKLQEIHADGQKYQIKLESLEQRQAVEGAQAKGREGGSIESEPIKETIETQSTQHSEDATPNVIGVFGSVAGNVQEYNPKTRREEEVGKKYTLKEAGVGESKDEADPEKLSEKQLTDEVVSPEAEELKAKDIEKDGELLAEKLNEEVNIQAVEKIRQEAMGIEGPWKKLDMESQNEFFNNFREFQIKRKDKNAPGLDKGIDKKDGKIPEKGGKKEADLLEKLKTFLKESMKEMKKAVNATSNFKELYEVIDSVGFVYDEKDEKILTAKEVKDSLRVYEDSGEGSENITEIADIRMQAYYLRKKTDKEAKNKEKE